MKTRTRKPKAAPLFDRPDETEPFESFPLMGTHCGACGEPQRMTPGGASCANGHGGAAALEDTRAPMPGSTPATRTHVDSVAVIASAYAEASKVFGFAVSPTKTRAYHDPETPNAKRPATAAHFEGVRLFEVPTTPLVQIDRWPMPAGLDVRGALVKLSPVIKSSERAGFDAASAKRELLAAGALAVSLAPKVVPDGIVTSRRDAAIRRAAAPHDAISAWFETAAGLDAGQRAAATDAALAIYDSALAAK
jgi:hypothetical protein